MSSCVPTYPDCAVIILSGGSSSRPARVSPAPVSTAIAYLEEQELVKRERDPRGGRERYAIDDDVCYTGRTVRAALLYTGGPRLFELQC